MGVDFKNLVSDMLPQFKRGLGSYASAEPDKAAKKAETPKRSAEEQSLFDLKAQLIDIARVNAHERGEQFSLEHYRKECELFATTTEEGKAMVRDGKWKPAIYADLSGQNLDGIRLSDPKAVKLTSPNKPGHQLTPATQADYDSFDRDGDGQINNPAVGQFYDEIRLNGASLRAAFVEPATSFNEEIAKAKNLEHMTFSGMTQDETFAFAAGSYYKEIHLEKVEGGTIIFNGSVEGLHLSGKQACIIVGPHAKVSKIEAEDNFRILDCKLGKGAMLSDCDLRKCTISMTSHFEPGSAIQNVQFGRNVNDLNLKGVELRNVAFNGVAITSREQLASLGVEVDATTRISASPQFILQITAQNALDAGVTDFSWNAGVQKNTSSEPIAQSSIDVPRASSPTARFEVADTNLTTALAGSFNPAKDLVARTIDPNDIATPMNMQRNSQA